jgi:Asp-tRNA(Asn)/Glu-tRNA(Gln) amidotransferase A subunit family amidase
MMSKSKVSSHDSVIGIAWYRPEEWEILRNASTDKDSLEETHAEWLKEAERVVEQLRNQGLQIVKIDVEMADLLLWCESQKIQVNAEERSKYVAFKVKQLSK